jgi:hypothetical protein
MRVIIILFVAILGLTLALPVTKTKRDAPYPAAIPHETYGLPVVKVEEVHDTPDCVFDGRWIPDLEKTILIDAPNTDYGLPVKAVETPHTEYGLVEKVVVLAPAPLLPALPQPVFIQPIIKVETPTEVYGPPKTVYGTPAAVYGLP